VKPIKNGRLKINLETGEIKKMKNEIKNYLSKFILAVATAISLLTGAALAQMPNRNQTERERIHRHAVETKSLAARQTIGAKAANVNLVNGGVFQNGKDFSMAAFDAEWMDEDQEAYNYTILDLVYLIDRLDGQPEAAQLQKTLRAVVRGTSTAALVKQDIERISNLYLARQKSDQKWYFNAGKTSMNVMIASFMGEDASIKKGLQDLQALIKTAPKGTAKEILNPMGALAKYVAQKTFTDEDYTAIYEGAGSIIEAATA
jgi:hypothetical protein